MIILVDQDNKMPKESKNTKKNNNADEMNDQEGGATKNRKMAASKKTMKKSAPAKSGSKATGKAGQKKTAAKKSTRGNQREEGKDRYFKLIDPDTNQTFGRYTGDTPKQAASKGYTKLLQKFKEEKKQPPKQSTIYLRESTRGSSKKVYGYTATRQKLDEPQELKITDKETGKIKTITYHYRNKIKKVAVPEQIGGAKGRSSKSKTSSRSGKKSARGASAKSSGSKKMSNTKSMGKGKKMQSNKKGGAAKKGSRSSSRDE